MKEMQKLQPEMQKLKERYPNDRMKQQEEMAALYKRYKINPIGGCLPMLLQIPVFFAFYKALLISIELRHAPFFGWIQDLSGRDPLLIWPLLMGGTQILMQKMTPTTSMDPAQARMMMLMPLVFIFLLLYFPAGLIIYWTCSNLVGIGQQVYVNRKS
jgi:YidC/Oxa1 family membrane protein insertase